MQVDREGDRGLRYVAGGVALVNGVEDPPDRGPVRRQLAVERAGTAGVAGPPKQGEAVLLTNAGCAGAAGGRVRRPRGGWRGGPVGGAASPKEGRAALLKNAGGAGDPGADQSHGLD